MCFCVRIGLFVVIWLIRGSFVFFIDFFLRGIFNFIFWDVLGRILMIFLWVRVFKCFLVVFVEWNFNWCVIFVWVGGMLVFCMVVFISLRIFVCLVVSGCIKDLFVYIVFVSIYIYI